MLSKILIPILTAPLVAVLARPGSAQPWPGLGVVSRRTELAQALGDTQLHGIAWLRQRWFVSGGNNGSNPNLLYEYDPASGTVRSFPQPGASEAGLLDLTTDFSRVYGGDDSLRIWPFDPNLQAFLAPIDVHAAASGNTAVRALAYVDVVPGTAAPGFVFTDGVGPLVFVDLQGTLIRTLPLTVQATTGIACLGFAPILLCFSQTDPGSTGGRIHFAGLDLTTGAQVPGFEFHGDGSVPGRPPDPTGGLAEGICVHTEGDRLVAMALHDALSDTAVSYQLGVVPAFAVAGSSCGAHRPAQVVLGLPELGTSECATGLVSYAPPGSLALALIGLSDRSWGGLPLPLDLAPIGLPNCLLRNSIEWVRPLAVGPGGDAELPLDIPADAVLTGEGLFLQWLTFELQGDGVQPGGVSPQVRLSIGGWIRQRMQCLRQVWSEMRGTWALCRALHEGDNCRERWCNVLRQSPQHFLQACSELEIRFLMWLFRC